MYVVVLNLTFSDINVICKTLQLKSFVLVEAAELLFTVPLFAASSEEYQQQQ